MDLFGVEPRLPVGVGASARLVPSLRPASGLPRLEGCRGYTGSRLDAERPSCCCTACVRGPLVAMRARGRGVRARPLPCDRADTGPARAPRAVPR